nr:MAG TPA: minor capsid protein [Microviridae sp.]
MASYISGTHSGRGGKLPLTSSQKAATAASRRWNTAAGANTGNLAVDSARADAYRNANGSGRPKTVSILDYLKKPARDDIGIVSGLYDDHGGSSGSGSSSAKKVIPYKNADWAALYGMDAGTAYAESMQNTTYQRTIKDMQAAGLNPAVMFANGANTNTSFYMGTPAPESGSSGGSSGSGSSSGRSAAGRSGKLFSPKMYSTISEVAGVAAAAITHRPWNYSSGKAIAQGAMRIANNLFGW